MIREISTYVRYKLQYEDADMWQLLGSRNHVRSSSSLSFHSDESEPQELKAPIDISNAGMLFTVFLPKEVHQPIEQNFKHRCK